ncbi:MAG: phage tail protein, partial [Rhodobacteraceae bacterium]|nr:phage tail protein [Paracoccaceae bacterium]
HELCARAGLDTALIDAGELADIVQGYVISALESPRASIATLARHFGFDAVESGGVIRFLPRGRPPVAVISPDQFVAAQGDVMELTRGQETELPQALKWQVIRADEEYDTATVEARRITVDASRIASESFPLAVPTEDADRRCRRALMEAWIGREVLSARLPPSRLALDPGDVVALDHDGRQVT